MTIPYGIVYAAYMEGTYTSLMGLQCMLISEYMELCLL